MIPFGYMRLSACACIAALAGCATAPCVPQPPQIVHVTVTKYVPIPIDLTAPVATPKPQDATVAECVNVNIQRAAAIGQCNAQLQAIRKLQPEGKP